MNTQLQGSTVVERPPDRLTVTRGRCSASPACCWPSCSSPRESPSVAAGRRAFRWLLVGPWSPRPGARREGPARPTVPRRGAAPQGQQRHPGHRPARPRAAGPGPGRPPGGRDRPRQPVRRAHRHRPGRHHPPMAASWTRDPTLRRWEFRLRPDARWSDGSPVRSTDFTYAWQRLADPKAEPAPSPAHPAIGRHRLPGPSPPAAPSSIAASRPRPATLVVRLDRPFADLRPWSRPSPCPPARGPGPAPTRPPT